MKKLLFALTILLVSLNLNAQTDTLYQKNLFYLCKTWGYAKYFHPQIAKGNVNWDLELLNAIDSTKNCTSIEEFNEVLTTMITNAGVIQTSSTIELPEIIDSLSNINTEWFYHNHLTTDNSDLLDTIKTRFRPQENVYLDVRPAGNIDFSNDKSYYYSEQFPEEKIRLLALFRFWNIFEYFSPYKNLTKENWDSVLYKGIPKVVEAANADEFHLVMKRITRKQDDSNVFFYSPTYNGLKGFRHTPFNLKTINNKTIVDQVLPVEENIKAGDIIIEVDGIAIDDYRDSLSSIVRYSNEAAKNKMTNRNICYGNTNREFTISNNSEIKTYSVNSNSNYYNQLKSLKNNYKWKDTTIQNYKFGQVNMGALMANEVDNMFDDLMDTEAIIFDIRNYPNGTLLELVHYLFEDPLNQAAFTVPNLQYPGTFNIEYETLDVFNNTSRYLGIVVILFDENTQSQAEYTCMGLEQHPYSIKIGSQTSGADGNVSIIYLTSEIYTYITGLGTYYYDHTPTQQIGIAPDIYAYPSIEGIKNGEDEVLEAAYTRLKQFFNINAIKNETSFNKEINIYPNPSKGELSIVPLFEDKILSVEIFNNLGRLVYSNKDFKSSNVLNIQSFNKGIYLLKVKTDNKTFTQKIIKK